jgi:hypothetical protein
LTFPLCSGTTLIEIAVYTIYMRAAYIHNIQTFFSWRIFWIIGIAYLDGKGYSKVPLDRSMYCMSIT